MMTVFFQWCLVSMLAASTGVETTPDEKDQEAPRTDVAPVAPSNGAATVPEQGAEKVSGEGSSSEDLSAPEPESTEQDLPDLRDRVRATRKSQRTLDPLLDPHPPRTEKEDVGSSSEKGWVGERRPGLLRPRRAGGALALGAIVGFGTGYYYAGELGNGLMFSIIDGVLLIGIVATTMVLNDLVIDHDFRSGKSLARGERDFGRREAGLYVASLLLALAEVGSHVFQGFGSMRAARRTNNLLRNFAFVPTDAGGAFEYRVEW